MNWIRRTRRWRKRHPIGLGQNFKRTTCSMCGKGMWNATGEQSPCLPCVQYDHIGNVAAAINYINAVYGDADSGH